MLNNFIKGTALLFLIASFVFCGVEEELKKINNKLDNIGKRLTTLEKKVGNAPSANNQNKKPQADPNAVYDISISNSVVLGNPNAKIVVTKWTDFQ